MLWCSIYKPEQQLDLLLEAQDVASSTQPLVGKDSGQRKLLAEFLGLNHIINSSLNNNGTESHLKASWKRYSILCISIYSTKEKIHWLLQAHESHLFSIVQNEIKSFTIVD